MHPFAFQIGKRGLTLSGNLANDSLFPNVTSNHLLMGRFHFGCDVM